ncbi:MAG: PadR family transcriptional regulator [Bacillota bacterium]
MDLGVEKLTQPAILLLLAQSEAHGYDLIQRLSQLDFMEGEPDTATVYRNLRRMEQDGLVVSQWQHGESGPARRHYRLTDSGLKLLDEWAQKLEDRMKKLESFILSYKNIKNHKNNK